MTVDFTNDPVLEPGQIVLAGWRQTTGQAFAWVPSGDIDALLAFIGEAEFAVIAGKLYRHMMDGTLVPVDVSKPAIVLRPLAGSPVFHDPESFKQTHCIALIPTAVSEAPVPSDAPGLTGDSPSSGVSEAAAPPAPARNSPEQGTEAEPKPRPAKQAAKKATA